MHLASSISTYVYSCLLLPSRSDACWHGSSVVLGFLLFTWLDHLCLFMYFCIRREINEYAVNEFSKKDGFINTSQETQTRCTFLTDPRIRQTWCDAMLYPGYMSLCVSQLVWEALTAVSPAPGSVSNISNMFHKSLDVNHTSRDEVLGWFSSAACRPISNSSKTHLP